MTRPSSRIAKRNGMPVHKTPGRPMLRQSHIAEPFRFVDDEQPRGLLARLFGRR